MPPGAFLSERNLLFAGGVMGGSVTGERGGLEKPKCARRRCFLERSRHPHHHAEELRRLSSVQLGWEGHLAGFQQAIVGQDRGRGAARLP